MRDMRRTDNDCCSLSKGTQSDGLISDTSTEELTSSSSAENFKECKTFEKVVVTKETKKIDDELQNSTNSTHSKPSTSLHQMRITCRSYIRWSVLLSFGTLLWIALWISDIFSPNPFLSKEGWILDLATAKKVTQKAGVVDKSTPPTTWWFSEIWTYAWDLIISVTTLEIIMFLCFVTLLVYFDYCSRDESTRKLCYVKIYKALLNPEANETATDDGNRHLDSLQGELASIEPVVKNSSDESSHFNQGDVRNLLKERNNEINLCSGEKIIQCLDHQESSPIGSYVSKSIKGSHNVNHRKRSFQLTSDKNYCNFSRKSNNVTPNVLKSKLIFNKPNLDFNRASPVVGSNKTRSTLEQSNLTCSVFNKSTSFESKKIETWFELPNLDQSEGVMHSFDNELHEYFNTRRNVSPQYLETGYQNQQQLNAGVIELEPGEERRALISNVNYNRGIVSSSPAFRRFLVNLAKDRMTEPYL